MKLIKVVEDCGDIFFGYYNESVIISAFTLSHILHGGQALVCHREHNKPALISEYRGKYIPRGYIRHGLFHRTNGPANGHIDNKLPHRQIWAYDGTEYTFEEFVKKIPSDIDAAYVKLKYSHLQ